MTSTSSKVLIAILAFTLVTGFTTAQEDIFSQDRTGSTEFDDTGFQVPEYESQEEILTEFVAPFLFVSVIMFLMYSKVLNTIFRDEKGTPYRAPPWNQEYDKPDVRRYGILLSLATTLMLVPTPFWQYIVAITVSLPLLVISLVLLMFLYGSYQVLRHLL